MRRASRSSTSLLTTSESPPSTYPVERFRFHPSRAQQRGHVRGLFHRQIHGRRPWHPWFDDTVFVFVADHRDGAVPGARKLEPHSKLIIYAPKFIRKPERRDPANQPDRRRADASFQYTGDTYNTVRSSDYVSSVRNYQVGLCQGNGDEIMRPVRGVHFYRDSPADRFRRRAASRRFG